MNRLFPCFVVVLSAACADVGETQVMVSNMAPAPDPDPAPTTWVPTADPAQVTNVPGDTAKVGCDQGFTYEGFGGVQLVVGRDEDDVGFDRDRVKPLSALRGEYARVLGKTPAVLDTLSNTFGSVPPRWYVEPEASAVSLFSSMRVAFAGCLELTASTAFDAAPTAANAEGPCTAFAHKFWSRAPDADELASCVDVATNKTGAEPQARRKWAYACASVLSSAGFLTY